MAFTQMEAELTWTFYLYHMQIFKAVTAAPINGTYKHDNIIRNGRIRRRVIGFI